MTEVGCSTSEDGVCSTARIAGITSMTTFFESHDLMRQMFDCIEKGDWQSATLVSKMWKDVSFTMPTWRTVRFGMARIVDRPYKKTRFGVSEVLRLSLKEILAKRKHIVHFILFRLDYELWADLAPSMAHVQCLFLSVHHRDGWGEMEPFRMDGLPSLTHLHLYQHPDRLPRHFAWLPALLALHLRAFLSLDHIVSGPSHGLDFQCPKLETLDLSVMRGMVIPPSLFSNLRILRARFHAIPDSMLDGNGTELVLGACPRLISLDFKFASDSIFITSLTLDLPSLEHLCLFNSPSLETLRLTCPNLVHVDMWRCPAVSLPPTLTAQLTTFDGAVTEMVTRRTHGNEANHRQGWPLLKRLRLGGSVVHVAAVVAVTLVCPSLRHLTIDGMKELKTCKFVSPVLSDLHVTSCPRLDVSSLIQPSLENVHVRDCNLEEGREWTLPNLRHLDLVDVKTTRITVNYAPPMSVGVDGGGPVHQMSVDWKDKPERRRMNTHSTPGISLRVSEDHTLFLSGKDYATTLRIVAPSATKLHLEGCRALEELDIECRLLLELAGDFPAKIREMVDNFPHKCPCLRKSR